MPFTVIFTPTSGLKFGSVFERNTDSGPPPGLRGTDSVSLGKRWRVSSTHVFFPVIFIPCDIYFQTGRESVKRYLSNLHPIIVKSPSEDGSRRTDRPRVHHTHESYVTENEGQTDDDSRTSLCFRLKTTLKLLKRNTTYLTATSGFRFR